MVPPLIFPSKTNEFSHQQHVAPLKLRHMATFFFTATLMWPKGATEPPLQIFYFLFFIKKYQYIYIYGGHV